MRYDVQERYFRRQFAGGRRLIGRLIDYAALRAVLFLAFYFFFKARVHPPAIVWLLAGISLLAAALLIRVVRECLYARFKQREKRRLFNELLKNRLMLLPTNEFLRLCDSLLEFARIPCPLQCAAPAGPDDILRFVRAAGDRPITIFSTAGYTREAEAFAARDDCDVRLTPVARLLDAAVHSRACPEESDLAAEIARLASSERAKRRLAAAAPLSSVRLNKYLIAAAFLTGASFLTGYALYYRLLAGLCMLLAALTAALSPRYHAS